MIAILPLCRKIIHLPHNDLISVKFEALLQVLFHITAKLLLQLTLKGAGLDFLFPYHYSKEVSK